MYLILTFPDVVVVDIDPHAVDVVVTLFELFDYIVVADVELLLQYTMAASKTITLL